MGKDHSIFPPSIGTFCFASIAVSGKYVTPEHVQNAPPKQKEDYITGMPHRFLGEILLGPTRSRKNKWSRYWRKWVKGSNHGRPDRTTDNPTTFLLNKFRSLADKNSRRW